MAIRVSSPSEQGVSPKGILGLLDALDAHPTIEPHGLIVQRHGHRVVDAYWAPHTPDRTRLVYSLSKTFTGTALALQLGEGRLGLDDPVADHLPDELADADPLTRQMRIRHLASMATGHDHDTLLDVIAADPTDVVRAFFTIPPERPPGTIFAYNQPPVLALATIMQRLAGQRLADYLRPRVLEPIGVTDLRWAQHQPGIDLAFSGVFTTLDAVARLGQLYLDDGVWDGRRLLPDGWVAQASTPQVANPNEPEPDWQQGYGFQLWMSRHGYRGDGAYGQLMVVLPEQDAVVAMFAATEDMQDELDLIWAHLLPAMSEAAADPGGDDRRLAERLGALTLPTPGDRLGGVGLSALYAHLVPAERGPMSHRTVKAIDVEGDTLVLHEKRGSLTVPLRPAWASAPGLHVAASATRLDDGRVAVDLVMLDSPHRLELVLDPAAGTFDTAWPAIPLYGGGLGPYLTEMHAPPS